VSDIVLTFGRREERQGDGDELADLIKGARSDGTEKRFQFREDLFNRIEVRAVGRQKPEVRARPFDRGADVRLFVHGEVVEDDDITGPQCRHQHLLDVGEKARVIDRPIEHGRGGDRVGPEGGDDGVRLPVTARRVVVKARAARTSSVPTQEVRRHAALVDKHIVVGVVQRQPVSPLPTLRCHISASLFVGVYGFF
jgi:hypothetical protein